MKKTLLILLTLIGLTSCMTVGRIERNCDKFTKVCGTDKVIVTKYRDTTIYRHDTIRVQLPSDTVRISDTVKVVDGIASMPRIKRKFGVITGEAWVTNSRLGMLAYLNDSTFKTTVHDTITIYDAIQHTNQTNTVTVRVKFIPKFVKFLAWIGAIALLFSGVFVVIKFKLYKMLKL